MKVTNLLVLCLFALTNLSRPQRIYYPEEDDPDFKRNIYAKDGKGGYTMVDLISRNVTRLEPRASNANIEFDLYTLNNIISPYVIKNNNINYLKKSNFNPKKLNLFIIHGWSCDRNSDVNLSLKNAVFRKGYDFNVFVVDWSTHSKRHYILARRFVIGVGQVIGKFINKIQATYRLSGSSFVVVGHSLGAHVAGSAGETVTSKIGNIMGLDPAAPLYTLFNRHERLDPSDAKMVQVIHTNGFPLGFASSLGHIDYYPNGGMSQPGCGWDFMGSCSHTRAFEYLAEAIIRGPVFKGVLCSKYSLFQNNSCANNPTSFMGQLVNNTDKYGDYFLKTNDKKPYGLN